jgi:hypothetical protein
MVMGMVVARKKKALMKKFRMLVKENRYHSGY